MTVFVARQPILDRSRRTCAYELLYRSGPDSGYDAPDADRATLEVIDTSFHVVGLETLTGRRRAFVNFTRDTLLKGYATSLPRECLVVEVLENVAPDAEVLEACRGLKAAGYPVALDDVITADLPGVLVDLADIVKVDFRLTDRATRSHIARALRGRGIRLLAEKVETETEFRQAHADGYELFQGYFFARPNVVSGRAIPAVKQNLLRLLHEAHRPDPNHRHFEEIIRQDMALAFKLLAHLRGAAWGQRRPVDSVRSALLLLGDRGIRKWASIVAIATLGQDRPPELVVTSLVRASFCEGIMTDRDQGPMGEEGFLVGLFSTIDAFLDLPLREALDRLALDDTVCAALLGGGHALRSVLDLALAYERGDWTDVSRLAGVVGVAADRLPPRYREAVAFGNAVLADA
jgi:EAL and modified HD-GYP domain-containing signal transduction protein